MLFRMFGSLGKAWGAVKDGAFESAAKLYLNQKIGSFGKVTQLSIDREAKRAFIQAELNGEVSPISVEVGRYELEERDGSAYVTIRQVSASREWIGKALQEYVVGREFKLPANAARFG
jgi:hypothetical protein